MDKEWGEVQDIFNNDSVIVSILRIKRNGKSSLHYHKHNHNYFHVISGKLIVRIPEDENVHILFPGESMWVPPGEENSHQFIGLEDSVVVEVVSVKRLPDDIVRIG